MGFKSKQSDNIRITGLWKSQKRDGLYSGKLRSEDIEALVEMLQNADDGVMFFLWLNEKRNRRDSDFTLKAAPASGDGFTKRKPSREVEEEEEEEKPRKKTREVEVEEDEEEEKPRKKSRDEEDEQPRKKGKKNDDW